MIQPLIVFPQGLDKYLLLDGHLRLDVIQQLGRPTVECLRKMKPFRQIEAAEHMVASAKYTGTFAQALLAMTPPELLTDQPSDRKTKQKIDDNQALLQQETASIVRDLMDAEASYGTDILALTVACGYLSRLLGNRRIEKHLAKHHPEILQTIRGVLSEMRPSVGHAAVAS